MFTIIPAPENIGPQLEGPLPVAFAEKKYWGAWATAGLGFAIFILHSITQVITLVLYLAIKLANSPEADFSLIAGIVENKLGLILALAVIASTIVGVAFVVLFARLPGKISVSDYLGLRGISGKTILWSLAIAIGFLLLSEGFSTITGSSSNTELQVNAYKTSMWPPLLFFAVVIAGPAFEEIFFRGFLFEGFRNSRIGIAGTIFLTTLLWTTLHIQYDIYGMVTIFVLGIVIGVVRVRTNSLWSCLLIHFVVNLTAMVQTALIVNGTLT
jgi:uncharacterized protein